jgi:hypothetical protein
MARFKIWVKGKKYEQSLVQEEPTFVTLWEDKDGIVSITAVDDKGVPIYSGYLASIGPNGVYSHRGVNPAIDVPKSENGHLQIIEEWEHL